MAEKILNTRLQLKIDTFANWSLSNATTQANKTNGDFVLKHGEIGLCEIKGNDSIQTVDPNGLSKTQVLFKVGDGTTPFKNLQWASALAADVYTWAKCKTVELDGEILKFHNGDKSAPVHSVDLSKFALDADLGNVATLTTTAKTAVGAINEHDTEIGDLASLNTTNKNSLVAAINEALQAVEVGGTGSVVTVVKEATPTNGSVATYTVKQGGNAVGDKIEVPEMIIETGANNGTIKVNGTDVAVKGLGSAAYTDVGAYATSAQGTKADNAAAAIATYGDIVTHNASEFAPANIDTGVHNVALAGGTNNGTLKLTVDGETTDNIAVTGLQSAAYVTVDSLNATAKGYADSKDGAIQAAQSDATIAKTKIETFLGTVTPDGSDAIIDTLTEINNYVGDHGEEFAALSGRVTNIEKGTTVVPKAEDANTLDGHDSDYFATSAENGAKALAEAALPKATAEADYLKKADAADIYATKSEATYAAGDNIDITNNTISLKDKLVGVTSIKGSQGLAGISIDDDGHISVNDAYGFNVYADSAYFNCGVQVKDKVKAAEVETQDLTINGDVTVGGKDLYEVINTTLVDEATKATNDGNGKNIANTYATKSEATYTGSNNISVEGKQIKLSTTLTGLESIMGNQTFYVGAQERVSLGSEFCTLDVGHEDIKIQSATGSSTGATIDLFGTGELNITAKDVNINGKAVHTLATSGNVNDLEQTAGDVLVFNCGTSTTVI